MKTVLIAGFMSSFLASGTCAATESSAPNPDSPIFNGTKLKKEWFPNEALVEADEA